MSTHKITEEIALAPYEFEAWLDMTPRIWDELKKEGLGKNQLHKSHLELDDIEYIFIRDDGWSIGCSEQGYASCNGLWPDDWKVIYSRL